MSSPVDSNPQQRDARRTTYARFERVLSHVVKSSPSITAADLSEVIGYARNTWHGWKRSGTMPLAAAIAAEAWLRAAVDHEQVAPAESVAPPPATAADDTLSPNTVLILRCSRQSQVDAMMGVCRLLGIAVSEISG